MSMSKQSLARTLALLAELRPRIAERSRVLAALAPTTEAGKAAIRRALAERRTTAFFR